MLEQKEMCLNFIIYLRSIFEHFMVHYDNLILYSTQQSKWGSKFMPLQTLTTAKGWNLHIF